MLILKGVDIKKNGKPDDILNTVFNEIDKLKLEIEDIEFDRAHRTGSIYKNNDSKLQEDVIVKFTSWSGRNILYNARTKSNFHVTASLTKLRSNLLAYAEEMVKKQRSYGK